MAVVEQTREPATAPDTTPEQLQAILEKQREAFLRHGPPSQAERELALDKLLYQVRKYQDEVAEAVSADFGNRSCHETRLAEISIPVLEIKHARKHLGKWMRPRRRPTSILYRPGKSKVHYQPLGVVGIIAPWNYPYQLAISPLVPALAAGNRVMIKPSELTPRTSELLRKVLGEIFSEEEVAVVTGGPEIGAAFSALPFDHLLYTGSTKVGRMVMKAAADNLVPVTLELGGKSPTIVGKDYPLEQAVPSIAYGKLLNGGQTCIAPDYTFVPEDRVDRFVDLFLETAEQMYPTMAENPDYTSIVSDGHFERITNLVEDARRRDARVFEHNPKHEDLRAHRKIPPTLILDATDEMDVMQEEIFGPVLPVLPYKDEDDVRDYVNRHPRPLALYYFSKDGEAVERIVERTTFGGGTINDVLFHNAQGELPFGGVGPSGIGAYHGSYGFETFSHAKGVFYQGSPNGAHLLRPPYGKLFDLMTRIPIGKNKD